MPDNKKHRSKSTNWKRSFEESKPRTEIKHKILFCPFYRPFLTYKNPQL